MLNPFRSGHIRTRLTLWYVAMLAAILLLYAAGSSLLVWRDLSRELDRHGIQDIETVEGLLQFRLDGSLFFNEDYHNHPESKRVLERYLEVLTPDGRVLLRNERLGQGTLGGMPFPGEGVGGYSPRWARLGDGTRIRLFSRRHNIGKIPVLMRVAYSEDAILQPSRQFLVDLLATLPFTLLLAGVAGYLLARKALRPVEEMTSRAEGITAETLGARLPVAAVDDEIAHLARVFNQMLARIEQAFEQLRRFTSDASHELRTPLAAIRGVGEVALQKNLGAGEYRDVIGSMLEEVGRLTLLTESLLTISRAEAGQIPLHLSEFPALQLAQETGGLLEVLAEEKSQQLSISGDPDAVISGDRILLRQALVNILHNAVRHTPSGGRISVTVEDNGDHWVSMRVADSGPGIAMEHAARVFDRFYRADNSRSAQSGGAGLGLAIAKWSLEAQHGELILESSPGVGCTFNLKLPRAEPRP
jgi:heavy metal sensor kinase